MKANKRKIKWKEMLIPLGLIILSLVPMAAGIFRMAQLGGGAEITPENARFFASPTPVILHIIGSILFSMVGAFQFAPSFRRRFPKWHRTTGRVLIPSGLIVALTGLWMTLFYQLPEVDGSLLHPMRLVVGLAMLLCIILGVYAIRQRKYMLHGDWMLRAYALGLGAGTQVFTHIPAIIFPNLDGTLPRAIMMGAGWAINIAVAEWVIYRKKTKRTRRKQQRSIVA